MHVGFTSGSISHLSHQILVSKKIQPCCLRIFYISSTIINEKHPDVAATKKCIPQTENLLTTYHNMSSSESFSKNEYKIPHTIVTHSIKSY